MTKIITAPRVHAFDTTVDAYAAVNSSDDISDGDVLIVGTEHVVGVAVSAWPTAYTPAHGAFHTLADGVDWSLIGKRPAAHVGTGWEVPADPGTDYSASAELARRLLERAYQIVRENGAELVDALDRAMYEDAHNLLP